MFLLKFTVATFFAGTFVVLAAPPLKTGPTDKNWFPSNPPRPINDEICATTTGSTWMPSGSCARGLRCVNGRVDSVLTCVGAPGRLNAMWSRTHNNCTYTAFPDCASQRAYCPRLPANLSPGNVTVYDDENAQEEDVVVEKIVPANNIIEMPSLERVILYHNCTGKYDGMYGVPNCRQFQVCCGEVGSMYLCPSGSYYDTVSSRCDLRLFATCYV